MKYCMNAENERFKPDSRFDVKNNRGFEGKSVRCFCLASHNMLFVDFNHGSGCPPWGRGLKEIRLRKYILVYRTGFMCIRGPAFSFFFRYILSEGEVELL